MKINDYRKNLWKNQHGYKRPWYQSTYWSLLILPALFFAALGTKDVVSSITGAHAQEKRPVKKIQIMIPELKFINRDDVDLEVKGLIKEVFRDDADRAFALLSCENEALDPEIINVNDDGSKDVGVFQINEKWQQVQARYLKNPRINILIAKQIYDEDGSFKMWTCGRKLGI